MELIVIACLLSAPDDCRAHRLRLSLEGGNVAHCIYRSPPRVAQWQAMHQNWKVRSWHCALLSKDEII
jgi:hypothetical protein